MDLLAEPEWFPKALTPVVVLRQTTPKTHFLHQALAADPLKPVGEFLPYLLKDSGVGPNMLQNVYTCMPENKIRYCFTDPTKGIGTICQNS
jgi:hypothetical protein